MSLEEFFDGKKIKNLDIFGEKGLYLGKCVGWGIIAKNKDGKIDCKRIEKDPTKKPEDYIDIYYYRTTIPKRGISFVKSTFFAPIWIPMLYFYSIENLQWITWVLGAVGLLILISSSEIYEVSIIYRKDDIEVVGNRIFLSGLKEVFVSSEKVDTHYVKGVKYVEYTLTKEKRENLAELEALRTEKESLKKTVDIMYKHAELREKGIELAKIKIEREEA